MATPTESTVNVIGQKSQEYEEKKERMIEKIQQRQEDRIAHIKKRQQDRENRSAKNESVEFFLSKFAEEKSAIETGLETVASKASQGTSKPELISSFDDISRSVQALQTFVTNSALFISAYDLQQAQENVIKLQLAVNEKRDAVMPKKKFAFKARKKETQQNNNTKTDDTVNGVSKLSASGKENCNGNVDAPDNGKSSGNAASSQAIATYQFQCGVFDKTNETIKLIDEDIYGKDVGLTNLTNCTIQLCGTPSAVHMDRITDCKIFCGPVPGSVFVDNCINSTLVLSCQQLRVHHTKATKFYLHVTSRGIIEDTNEVQFAPYNWVYPGIEEDYKKSDLDQTRNNWDDIDDFNWLASDKHSPNWSLVPEHERVSCWNTDSK